MHIFSITSSLPSSTSTHTPYIFHSSKYRASAFPSRYSLNPSPMASRPRTRSTRIKLNQNPGKVRLSSSFYLSHYQEFQKLKAASDRCEKCKRLRCSCANK